MREIPGVLHVHSAYSKDGEMDLADVALAFRRDGHHFMCLTEHADDLDADQMAGLIERCRNLSDDSFCLIPGLEFQTAEGLHMLGLGLTAYVSKRSAREIIAAIHVQGSLAILAHPEWGAERLLAGSEHLPDGLELWNTKYDTRYAPRLHRFSMLRQLRVFKRDIWGYCSVDFHWMNQYRKVSLVVQADRIAPEPILEALKAGRFVCRVGRATLGAQGRPSGLQVVSFGLRQCGAQLLLLVIRGIKRTAQALHLPLPTRRLRAIALRVT